MTPGNIPDDNEQMVRDSRAARGILKINIHPRTRDTSLFRNITETKTEINSVIKIWAADKTKSITKKTIVKALTGTHFVTRISSSVPASELC